MDETPGNDRDDGLSEETRMLIARAREQAAQAPDAAELAAAALSQGRQATPAEVQHLFADAISHANQISFLLGKLAGLIGSDGPEASRG